MMKTLIYFFLLLFFACQNNEPMSESKYSSFSSLLKTNLSAFEGTILGKYTTGLEHLDSKGFGWFFSNTNQDDRYIENNLFVQPTKIRIAFLFSYEEINNTAKSLYFFMPMINNLKYNDFSYLKVFLGKGKREFNKQINFSDSLFSSSSSFINTFIVSYNRMEKGEIIELRSSWGNQNGSFFEILESKEYVDNGQYSNFRGKGFYLKFLINCKLYDKKGNYEGDIKDLNMVVKFNHTF